MASRRPGPQTFGWLGHRSRDSRAGEDAAREEGRSSSGLKASKTSESAHSSSRSVSQPSVSIRLPQAPLSQRRPSDGQVERSRLLPQPKVRAHTGITSSSLTSTIKTTITAGATTTSSSKLQPPSSKPRVTLHRKRSQELRTGRTDASNEPSSHSQGRCETPLDPFQSPEIRIAQQVEITTTKAPTVTIYPELDRYRDVHVPRSGSPGSNVPYRLATQDLPPPTPLFSGNSSQISAFSGGSPSTRWSESPGPGPYSRDTTPTSMTSQSPGLVLPTRVPPPGSRTRPGDSASTRPPVSRSRGGSISNETEYPEGLPTVAEISSNSSSNSTVRATDAATTTPTKDRTKAKASTQRSPSPPPRKTSVQHQAKGSRDEGAVSPTGSAAAVQKTSTTSAPSSSTKSPTLGLPRPRFGQPKPPSASSSPTIPPARPSREGTSELPSQLNQPIPVIQSNLSSTSLAERRQSGLVAPVPATRPATLTRSNTTTRRPASKEPASTASDAPSKQEPARHVRTPSPAVSSGFKSRFPLFGRRTKTTAEPDKPSQIQPAQQEKKDRPHRRGPAAGTGHEGYGKLGLAHRRSNSITYARGVIPGTMSSQESLHSSQSVPADPFLAQRMAPVIIAGGEVVENRNTLGADLTRTESNQSYASGLRRPSVDSRNSSQLSISSTRDGPSTKLSLWPSPLPRTQLPSAGKGLAGRRPSESSDSDVLGANPTLALRRSVQRLKAAAAGAPVNIPKVPKPIVTSTTSVVSPSMTSLDASILSDDSVFDPSAEPVVGRSVKPPSIATAVSSSGPKKLVKRPRSPRKWNLFSRSQTRKEPAKAEPARAVAATVQAVKTKPVAFYAIMDPSDPDDNEPVDLEEVLREARGIAITTPAEERQEEPRQESRRPSVASAAPPSPIRSPPQRTAEPQQQQQQQQQQPSSVARPAPATPAMSPPAVPKPAKSPEPTPAPASQTRQAPTRPSRLPQVGRIPKVVSNRSEPKTASNRTEHTSPKSFSRPFNRLSTQLPTSAQQQPQQPSDCTSATKGSSLPKPSAPVRPNAAAPVLDDGDDNDDKPPHDTSNFETLIYGIPRLSPPPAGRVPTPGDEFLRFSPRKDSQSTTATTATTMTTGSTSSCGMPGYVAAVPDAGAPLAEDEIWDEYNDLLGDDETVMMMMRPPAETAPRSGKGKGKAPEWPRPLRLQGSQANGDEEGLMTPPPVDLPLNSPTLSPPALPSLVQTLRDGMVADHPSIGARGSEIAKEVRRMLDCPEDGDEEENKETPAAIAPAAESAQPESKGEEAELPVTLETTPNNNNDKPEAEQARRSNASSNCTTSTNFSDDNSPQSQVNLRVGSMTVSRWLTFGHVLFSPLRDELLLSSPNPAGGSLERPCILVVDGLGNDDWSFYAAETYPGATFFNLSPRAPLRELVQQQQGQRSSNASALSGNSTLPLIPPNHHQVQWHLSKLTKFPFGAGSFTAVVFRFPAAGPESHYRHVISEARRVLQPGGYLELSILDVDLNNMGPRCRRAVRRLKERIHARAPQTSLAPASDLILRLVGRRGFVEVKTCRVGVPVAGAIATAKGGAQAAARRPGEKKKKDQRSLPEMMNEEGPVADESIARSVAKVGRWWYSRCYESAARAGGVDEVGEEAIPKDSMWRDRALLAECQEWGTSLKLMVCHARAPPARVASI